MRLATNGASRKTRISIRLAPGLLFCFVERFFQLGDIVIEQLEIIGDLFFAANARREHDNFPARVAGNSVGSFQVEIRLDTNDFDAVALHLADEFNSVLRTGRNAGTRLDIADYVEVEVFSKIRPRAVIGDDFPSR